MDKILSKDEMNALLNSPAAAGEGSGAPAAEGPRVAVYNFRRPDRLSKASLQSLQLLHERFCTNAAASLSASFRTLTEMSVLSIEQANFSEFLSAMPDPGCLSALNMRPLQGTAILEIGPDAAFPLIDRLLGGAGGEEVSDRKMTEIEKNVIRGVINLLTADLKEVWRPITEVQFALHSTETRPQLLQVAAPSEVVIVVALELKMGEIRSTMHLCIPFPTLQPILGAFEQDLAGEKSHRDPKDLAKVLRCLMRIPVDLRCELPATMVTVNDLLNMAKDDVLRLDAKLDDRVRVRVGGQPTFDATLMVVDGYKAAGITGRTATGG